MKPPISVLGTDGPNLTNTIWLAFRGGIGALDLMDIVHFEEYRPFDQMYLRRYEG